MTNTKRNSLSPLDIPVPLPREGEVLTESQWETLMAIADTVIPSIEVSSSFSKQSLCVPAFEYSIAVESLTKRLPVGSDPGVVKDYLHESASSIPGFRVLLRRTLGDFMREDARKKLRVVLTALDTRVGCLLITGYSTPFHLHPINIRQQILQSWAHSYLKPLRQSAKGLAGLLTQIWMKTSPSIGPILGFPRTPIHGKPGKGFDYKFLQFPPGVDAEVIETDVVIIGSGCGGAVCAKNLAETGHRVIVVDKAYHWGPEYLPMTEQNAGIHLFENGGIMTSDDGSITVIAGQAWGGGGTINWSASLQTQAFVRKEWSDKGLPFFTSSEFQNSLDRICHRMGVSTDFVEHNKTNAILAEGARKLGYSHKTVPQNTGGHQHQCGYCTLGCGSAEKQGPVVSFLPDAERSGAHFIEGFEVDKVLIDQVRGKRIATGIKGRWTSRDTSGGVSGKDCTFREVTVNAKQVILCVGTLSSPLILRRSGLTNPQIGRNLYLHPVTIIGATFPDSKPINPWEGAILTTVVDEFQNLDAQGHGVKLEALTMLPSWVLPPMPWNGGLEFKQFCSNFPFMTCYFPMVRERNPGFVYADPLDGKCRISYSPDVLTKKYAMKGLIALAQILYIQGAEEIFTVTTGMSRFKRSGSDVSEDSRNGINDPAFQSWLSELRKCSLDPPETGWGSAHQMGTCRMATSEHAGVVDPHGKVWGVDGLYVSDASVFPSASGVNPMVTNMAISDWISRGIASNKSSSGAFDTKARL